MKKLTKTLSLVLVVAMVLGLCVIGAGATFTDNDKITKDYSEAVGIMTDLGCVSGVGNNTFAPTGTFTRAQAAVILTRLTLGASADNYVPSKVTFKDVPASFWGYKFVEYAVQSGFVAGTGNGMYSPNATLTGYQWAAMLLKVLNIAVPATGSDWQINTARAYYGADKFSNITISAANITREAATQMAYDALFTVSNGKTGYPVYYKFGTADQALIGVYDNLADAAVAATTLGGDYSYKTTTQTMNGTTLAKTVFGVTKALGLADSFGRPANAYTVSAFTAKKNATVAASYGWNALTASKTIAAAPVATYTTAVTANELYKALGYAAIIDGATSSNTAVATTAGYLKADMTSATANITVSAKTVALGGAGVVTEIYATSTTNHYIVVQIRPTLAKVDSVSNTPATATNGAFTTYSINGVSCKVYTTVVDKSADITNVNFTAAVVKGDFVMICGNATAGYTVSPAKIVTGTVTGYASATNAWTIGGTSYPTSTAAIHGTDATAVSGVNATSQSYALDTYGNVVGSVTVNTPNNYVFVVKAGEASYLNTTTNQITTVRTATVVTTDGTLQTVKTDATAVTDLDNARDAGSNVAGLFTYAIDAKTGYYKLTYATQNLPTGVVVNTKNTIVKDNPTLIASTLYANGATKYYVATKDVDGNYTGATAYTGYNNMPSTVIPTNAAAIDANGDTIAEVVFLDASVAAGVSAQYVYVTGSYSVDANGVYTYDVIVNGQPTTMKLTSGAPTGLCTVASGTATAVPGTADVVLNVTAGTDGIYGTTAKFFSYNNGLLMKCGTADGTYDYLATIGATVPVYTFANGACTASTADGLSATTGSMIVFSVNAAHNAIQAVYIVK